MLPFIFGISVCAVLLGALWLLREGERARAFKAMRKDINTLREIDARRRQIVASVYVRMQEFNLSLGGKALPPAPAMQVGQRPEDLAYSRGRHYAAASHFSGRGR